MNKFLLNSFNEPIEIDYIGKPIKIELISLLYKKKTFDLNKTVKQQEIFPFEVVWIRIFDDQNVAYNVVAKNVLIISNESGLLIQINSEYEEVSVKQMVPKLRELALKSSNPLDFEKESLFEDYMKYMKAEVTKLQKQREIYIKNSSTNSDIAKLNDWVNKRDEIIYELTRLEILKKLAADNRAEIEEVINEKRLGFV